MLLAEVIARPFRVGSSWRKGVEESARLVVQPVSAAIWVEGILV